MNMIRVILPTHLRTLAHVGSEVTIAARGTIFLCPSAIQHLRRKLFSSAFNDPCRESSGSFWRLR